MKKAIVIGIAFMLVFLTAIAVMPSITIAQPQEIDTDVTGVVKDANGITYPNSPPNSITITTSVGTYQTQTDGNGTYIFTTVTYTDNEDPQGGGIIDPTTGQLVDMYVDFDDGGAMYGAGNNVTGHNNTKNAVESPGTTIIDITTDQLIPEFSTTALIPMTVLVAVFGIFAIRRRK